MIFFLACSAWYTTRRWRWCRRRTWCRWSACWAWDSSSPSLTPGCGAPAAHTAGAPCLSRSTLSRRLAAARWQCSRHNKRFANNISLPRRSLTKCIDWQNTAFNFYKLYLYTNTYGHLSKAVVIVWLVNGMLKHDPPGSGVGRLASGVRNLSAVHYRGEQGRALHLKQRGGVHFRADISSGIHRSLTGG